jgi:hypothetical protein
MSRVSARRIKPSVLRLLPLAASLAGAMLLAPQAGMAQEAGPFAMFAGSWRGSGQVVGTDGNQERLTCRAHYSIPPSGAALSQSLVCASDSYRFQVQSDVVVVDGHNVQGQWQEATRSATGELVGQIADGRFDGNVSGTGFTAEISIRTRGAKQSVSIIPHGANVTKVDMVLSRER